VLAAAIVNFENIRHERYHPLPNVFLPNTSPIVDRLRSELEVPPNGPFRGRVVTLTGQDLPAGTIWSDMHVHAIRLIEAVGNDHRTIGLWYDPRGIQPDDCAASLCRHPQISDLPRRSAVP
jgi:hypothetical protein